MFYCEFWENLKSAGIWSTTPFLCFIVYLEYIKHVNLVFLFQTIPDCNHPAIYLSDIWDKVFKNGLIKFCGRQPLKNLLSPLLNIWSHLLLLLASRYVSMGKSRKVKYDWKYSPVNIHGWYWNIYATLYLWQKFWKRKMIQNLLKQISLLNFNYYKWIIFQLLLSSKKLIILKQNCSFRLHICFSMYYLLVDTQISIIMIYS